uniref:Uncharacterized protein n=1 Tax=Amphora coffeiformis TaxID=265554 RepID=A0A7S3L257_9STRA
MRRSAGEKEDPLADSSASSRERTRRRWDGTFVADDEAAAAEQGQGGPLELPATTTTTALPAIPDQPSLSYLLQRGHLHMHRNVRRNQPSTTTTSTTTTTTTTRPPHRHMARLPRSDTLRALLLDDHDHDDDDDDDDLDTATYWEEEEDDHHHQEDAHVGFPPSSRRRRMRPFPPVHGDDDNPIRQRRRDLLGQTLRIVSRVLAENDRWEEGEDNNNNNNNMLEDIATVPRRRSDPGP